jgi:hypothetical protein
MYSTVPTEQHQLPVPADAIEAQLQRILGSSHFAGADRLAAFLECVVRKSLAGRADEIKEYSIATEVFGRPATFDPRLDTIVRVQASKLRSRLADYYATAGTEDPIRIELPRGAYVPAFAVKGQREHSVAPVEHPVARRPSWLLPAAGVAVLITAALWLTRDRTEPSHPPLIQFEIPPPADMVFYAVPNISAQRDLLVCAIQKRNRTTALWARSLAGPSGHILPGTEGMFVGYPSPDASYIVGLSWTSVYRVDVAGARPPELIAPISAAFGVAPHDDGFLLLGRVGAPIGRMPVSGGPMTPQTALDDSRQEISHYWPVFLPGANEFVYFARSRNPALNSINVSSLDGKRKRRLIDNEASGRIVTDPNTGTLYLMFVRSGTLYAQAYDPEAMALGGNAFPVANGVRQMPQGFVRFSASNTGILVHSSASAFDTQFTWFDRSGKELGKLGPVGDGGDPAISPDGKLVAYDLAEGPNRDIWMIDVATGQSRRLTFDPEVDHVPVWSQNGEQILFDSHRTAAADLYVVPAAGGAQSRHLPWPSGLTADDWSSDGQFVFLTTFTPEANSDIRVLPADAHSEPFVWLQTKANEFNARLSHDRRWLAYVSDESGRNEIYVQSFDGSSRAGADKWQISTEGGTQPRWRRDGRELFYVTPDSRLMVVELKAGQTFSYGKPRLLFAAPEMFHRGPRNDYDVTPDGQKFLIRTNWRRDPPAPVHVVVNWSVKLAANSSGLRNR